MGEIGGLAAAVGVVVTAVVTGLVTVIGHLLVDQRGDRRIYEAAIAKAEARADAAELRAQAAWVVADEARRAHHLAEDALAELRRTRGVGP